MTFGRNPLQNSWHPFKSRFCRKDSIARIEKQLRTNPMISDIVYDKQLVNLVNDNIKKVSMWILIISGFLAFIAVLLISSLRLSIHSNRFIIKLCKWWVQQNHLSENHLWCSKTGHARCWFSHYCIDWCVIRRNQLSWLRNSW
jgi:hypothetical protein